MKKTFVLDTNVLIHDPASLFKFENNNIVIPFTVIEELDKLKKGRGEIAVSARQVLRTLDEFRETGSLIGGIPMDTRGTLTVCMPSNNGAESFLDEDSDDNQIINSALRILRKKAGDGKGDPVPVILVSKDTAVRIKAESMGLTVEDYKSDKTSLFQQYGKVLTEGDNTNGIRSVRYLLSESNVYKLSGVDNTRPIKRAKERMGVAPQNVDQECTIDALTDP